MSKIFKKDKKIIITNEVNAVVLLKDKIGKSIV